MQDPQADIAIYPNPTTGTFVVELPAEVTATSIKVVNHFGKVVHTLRPANESQRQFSLDLGREPLGLYEVRIETNQGVIARKVAHE